MEATTDAGAAGSEQTPIPVMSVPGEGSLSITAAARALVGARHKQSKQQDQRPTSEQRDETAQPPAAEPRQASGEESTASSDDAAAETPPGEAESADPAALDPGVEAGSELPPIEPPRSWTKADKELFAALPRETQERVAERERARDTDFSRRQQEAAEKLKGVSAKELAVEQARQYYEAALPQLLQILQHQQAGEFADIRSIADAERLAREDWPRYLQWDLALKRADTVAREVHAAQHRQAAEQQQRFTEFAKRQDDLLAEKVPEIADHAKAAELQKAAVTALRELGFDDAELGAAWNGRQAISLRDHRVQLLVRDAALWRQAQAKAKAAAQKPVPPVQRPGTSQGQAAEREMQLKNLDKQLDSASGVNALRAAAKLVSARRAAR